MHTDRHLTAVLALLAAVLPAASIEREGSFDRTLTVSGPVELDVNTRAGRIAVRAGQGGSVRIHGTIRPQNGRVGEDLTARIRAIEQNPPIHQAGNAIRINSIGEEEAGRRLSVSYEITVPAETRLRARTGSGGMAVEGIGGPADVKTGSGAVTVARVGGEVRAYTGSGHIEVDAVKGGLDAHTGSGGIAGAGIAGPIVAHTGSGGIKLEQTAAAPVKAHTGSGGVTVRLPGQAGFDLRAHTGSGKVYCEQAATVRAGAGRRELDAKLHGGGPLVEISTGSGSVRIE